MVKRFAFCVLWLGMYVQSSESQRAPHIHAVLKERVIDYRRRYAAVAKMDEVDIKIFRNHDNVDISNETKTFLELEIRSITEFMVNVPMSENKA